MTRQAKKPVPRGYLRGQTAAAHYVGLGDRSSFRDWQNDPNLDHRDLLQPRIINGIPYYSIKRLDAFMDPDRNAPGATTLDHSEHLPKPKTRSRHDNRPRHNRPAPANRS